MITMPNGVVAFDTFDDYTALCVKLARDTKSEDTFAQKLNAVCKVAVYADLDHTGSWGVEIIGTTASTIRKIGVFCSKQDAIDIASMFAQRASHKDCDNCGNEPSLNPNGMQADEPCLSCLREGNKSGWTPIKAKDCPVASTPFCERACKKNCTEKGDAA